MMQLYLSNGWTHIVVIHQVNLLYELSHQNILVYKKSKSSLVVIMADYDGLHFSDLMI